MLNEQKRRMEIQKHMSTLTPDEDYICPQEINDIDNMLDKGVRVCYDIETKGGD